MQRILIIEDSPEFQLIMKRALGDRFEVTCVGFIKAAQQELAGGNFDLILLDIELPDGDGFRLCSELHLNKRLREIPLLIVSGRNSVTDKITGFSLGADDYIVKPFDPLEFRARVEARIRKSLAHKEEGSVLRIADLEISASTQKCLLHAEGQAPKDLNLTPNEFKLLFGLAKHPDRVYSRKQLLDAIWGENMHVVDRVVDKHISSLRKKLASKQCRIETVTGSGYRFTILDQGKVKAP